MGNTKSMSSINTLSREHTSTKPMPKSTSETITKKFYLNLSELKSGMGSKTSTEPSPSSSYTDEYTSLNEIIDSIDGYTTPPPQSASLPQIESTDNYADLDLEDNTTPNEPPFTIRSPKIDLDSQLYSNINVVHHDIKSRNRRHIQSGGKNSGLVQYLLNMNLSNLHRTTNILSKLSKNIHKKPKTSETKKLQDFILILPPRKCFDPTKEMENLAQETSPTEQLSVNSSITLSHDTSEELDSFYQTLNHNPDNHKYNDLGDYEYLVSYEWPSLPKISTPPLPPPASTQPNRTQAILKFYEYY